MQAIYRLSDVVVNHFLAFFRAFFIILGRSAPIGTEIAENLPPSLHVATKTMQKLEYKKYVVCRKCHKLYNFSDCIYGSYSKRSKLCSFCQFPNHPHLRMRQQCASLLLKTVEMSSGTKIFYPFLTYCYVGLEASLQMLLHRPSFFSDCEAWRHRNEDGMLHDVYDGRVWKEFMNYKGTKPFLSQPGNFALIMNMDFFQPYKHVQYSVGAIYLNVLNLSRDIRYKQENTILLGLIPGPCEPKHDINSFLDPFVEELLKFWNGIDMSVFGNGTKKIGCALLCVACDLPAGRKVCGFLGRNARLGCTRCYKEFSGTVGSMAYSGFERERDGV